jgi:hypothetical protein
MSAKLQILVIVVCVYFLAVAMRIGVCQYHVASHHNFLPFTGESALLYRYAEMTAKGEEIPEPDYAVQYPEGLSVKHQLSLGWEFIAGTLYKLFFREKVPFHSFVRYFTPFFFCISIFPLFLIIRQLSGGEFGAVIGTLFYAVSLPAVIRATGQEISRENYCLPVLFFHIYFLVKYMRNRKVSSSVLAGLFLSVSLAFWEGAQVYFYLLVIFMVFQFIFNKDFFELRQGAAPPLRAEAGFTVIIAFAALAGIFIPYLRSHFFIMSYPMLASFSLIGAGFLFRKKYRSNDTVGNSRRLRVIAFVLFFLTLSLITSASGYGKTYSHMQTLLWYKVRFLNQKPYDPNLLPYDARILWTPALTSPKGTEILYHFSTLLPLCVFSIIPVVFRSKGGKERAGTSFSKGGWGIGLDEKFLLLNLLFFFFLYLMFKRMEVFLVFFICIFIGRWAGTIMKHSWKVVIPVYFVISFCIFFESSKVIRDTEYLGRPVDYLSINNLLSWIRGNTRQESVILSHFNLSPVISLYAGRKIVLHPKFESPYMREKVERYLCALFDRSEDKFYSFCQEAGAQTFVYPRGTFSTDSRYSWRYMTAVPASQVNCNAYMFERRPSHLKKFELKYDNGRYMVYKIYKPDEIKSAVEHLDKGNGFFEMHLYEKAISEYKRCIEIYPKCVEGYARLGTAYYLSGEEEKAAEFWRIAYDMQLKQK